MIKRKTRGTLTVTCCVMHVAWHVISLLMLNKWWLSIDRSAVTSRFWLIYFFGLYHLTVTPPIISLKIHPYLELLQFSQVVKFTRKFQVHSTFTYAVSQWESKVRKKQQLSKQPLYILHLTITALLNIKKFRHHFQHHRIKNIIAKPNLTFQFSFSVTYISLEV